MEEIKAAKAALESRKADYLHSQKQKRKTRTLISILTGLGIFVIFLLGFLDYYSFWLATAYYSS